MSVREVKAWLFSCDICSRTEGPIFSEHKPHIPHGWGRRTLTDCGMTGYTRREIVCPLCVEKGLADDA